MLIIFLIISLPLGYGYYFTDWRNSSLSRAASQTQIIPEFQEESKIYDNRIVLRKDKSITVNKNRLVFKGLKDKMIHLDVYLLELDPEYAYPYYISTAKDDKRFRLGDSTFQLLKVNHGALQLKIVDLYES